MSLKALVGTITLKSGNVVEVLDSLMGCDLENVCAKAERHE
jgi:hypothetical protein